MAASDRRTREAASSGCGKSPQNQCTSDPRVEGTHADAAAGGGAVAQRQQQQPPLEAAAKKPQPMRIDSPPLAKLSRKLPAYWGPLGLVSGKDLTAEDFWALIDELKDDQSGFLSNRATLLEAWRGGYLHGLAVVETDGMYRSPERRNEPLFCKGSLTMYLPAPMSVHDRRRWRHHRRDILDPYKGSAAGAGQNAGPEARRYGH